MDIHKFIWTTPTDYRKLTPLHLQSYQGSQHTETAGLCPGHPGESWSWPLTGSQESLRFRTESATIMPLLLSHNGNAPGCWVVGFSTPECITSPGNQEMLSTSVLLSRWCRSVLAFSGQRPRISQTGGGWNCPSQGRCVLCTVSVLSLLRNTARESSHWLWLLSLSSALSPCRCPSCRLRVPFLYRFY